MSSGRKVLYNICLLQGFGLKIIKFGSNNTNLKAYHEALNKINECKDLSTVLITYQIVNKYFVQ